MQGKYFGQQLLTTSFTVLIPTLSTYSDTKHRKDFGLEVWSLFF